MSALTPTFVREVESKISAITLNSYAGFSADAWWQDVATKKTTNTKRETLVWLLNTAMIRAREEDSSIHFDDILSQYTELEPKHASAGLKLKRAQLEDVVNGEPGGEGLNLAAHWANDQGEYMGYWPQKLVSQFLRTAHLAPASGGFNGYDGQIFFSAAHPYNPFDASAGTFSNLLTGGTAAPVLSVTDDVALANLGKVWAHIVSIKQANGEDPRGLRPQKIICGPQLFLKFTKILNAQVLAAAAASGGGSADFKAFVAALKFAQPVLAPELAGFESEETYFVTANKPQGSDLSLGGVVYVEREAFNMTQYGILTDAELSRMQELEWHIRGRNGIAAGHPYMLFKVKAT